MNDVETALKELLDDLIPTLQAAESNSAAVLQLLQDKGIVSADELARYLERAATASSVKERAARLRFEHLLASAIKSFQQSAQDTAKKAVQESQEQSKPNQDSAGANHESMVGEKDKHASVSEGQSRQAIFGEDSSKSERAKESSTPDSTRGKNVA